MLRSEANVRARSTVIASSTGTPSWTEIIPAAWCTSARSYMLSARLGCRSPDRRRPATAAHGGRRIRVRQRHGEVGFSQPADFVTVEVEDAHADRPDLEGNAKIAAIPASRASALKAGHKAGAVRARSGCRTGRPDRELSMQGPSPRLNWSSSILRAPSSVAASIAPRPLIGHPGEPTPVTAARPARRSPAGRDIVAAVLIANMKIGENLRPPSPIGSSTPPTGGTVSSHHSSGSRRLIRCLLRRRIKPSPVRDV